MRAFLDQQAFYIHLTKKKKKIRKVTLTKRDRTTQRGVLNGGLKVLMQNQTLCMMLRVFDEKGRVLQRPQVLEIEITTHCTLCVILSAFGAQQRRRTTTEANSVQRQRGEVHISVFYFCSFTQYFTYFT